MPLTKDDVLGHVTRPYRDVEVPGGQIRLAKMTHAAQLQFEMRTAGLDPEGKDPEESGTYIRELLLRAMVAEDLSPLLEPEDWDAFAAGWENDVVMDLFRVALELHKDEAPEKKSSDGVPPSDSRSGSPPISVAASAS